MTTIETPIGAYDDLEGMLRDTHRMTEFDLEQALVMAGDVLVLARERGSAFHEGRALQLRGWARFGIGDVADAVADHIASLELARQHDDEVGVGRALHALGSVYDTIGESAVALDHYHDALELQSKIGDDWGAARTHNGLAVGLADGKQFGEAIEAFREVAAAFSRIGDLWWVAMARANRCVTQLEFAQGEELSEPERTSLLKATLAECNEIAGDAAGLGESGRSVGTYARHCIIGTLLELGDPKAALKELEETIPIANQAGDVTVLVDLEKYTARALEDAGRPDKVFEHLDRAEELARSSGRDRHLGQILELRAKLCEGRGDLAEALLAMKRFNEVDTRTRSQANDLRAKVFRSLLETQRAEIDLARARTQVDQLKTITQERTRMVSAIAHELRNPITTVVGLSSEICRNWDTLGDEGFELMEMVRAEAEDLANIVEDLLAAGSIEQDTLRVEVEPCELGPMVSSVIERTDLDGKDATSYGSVVAVVDQVRFRQVLRNLVINAVRYGGDSIWVNVAEDDKTAIVEVCDNGDGIALEDRERVFEAYQRGSGGFHGSRSIGLGLAVTCQLVRLMGGEITYDYVDNESVFRLVLPRAT